MGCDLNSLPKVKPKKGPSLNCVYWPANTVYTVHHEKDSLRIKISIVGAQYKTKKSLGGAKILNPPRLDTLRSVNAVKFSGKAI